MMKTYYVQFTGYGPNALAIVVARSRPQALRAFLQAAPFGLRYLNEGSNAQHTQITVKDFKKVDPSKASVNIILDGDE